MRIHILVLAVVLVALSTACASNQQEALDNLNRGNSNYDLGEYEHAIADYDQAIALDPQFDHLRVAANQLFIHSFSRTVAEM